MDYQSNYQQPAAQNLLAKQTNAIVMFNLPELQNYYTDINRKDEDDVNIQLTYVDIPMQDSITKTYGPEVELKVQYRINYARRINGSDQLDSAQDELTIFVSLVLLTSPYDLAERIKQALINAFAQAWRTESATQPMQNGIPSVDMGISMSVGVIMGGLFSDFYYDEVTQRYAFSFREPAHPRYLYKPEWDASDSGPHFTATSINVTFKAENPLKIDKTGKLLAAMLGGTYGVESDEITVTFTTQVLEQPFTQNRAFELLRGRVFAGSNQDLAEATLLFDMREITLYSSTQPCFYLDQYVYILTNSETNLWSTKGTKSSVLAVVPRNREAGKGQTSTNSYLTSHTQKIKTKLSSLRNLRLQLADAEGYSLVFDTDFMIIVTVTFDVKQYYLK